MEMESDQTEHHHRYRRNQQHQVLLPTQSGIRTCSLYNYWIQEAMIFFSRFTSYFGHFLDSYDA